MTIPDAGPFFAIETADLGEDDDGRSGYRAAIYGANRPPELIFWTEAYVDRDDVARAIAIAIEVVHAEVPVVDLTAELE